VILGRRHRERITRAQQVGVACVSAGVGEDWASADVPKRDNWRKELADAGGLVPSRSGTNRMQPESPATRLCRARVSRVIGSAADRAADAFRAPASEVYTDPEGLPWRVDASLPAVADTLRCGAASDDAADGG
jgi:hypothetical protein